MFHTFNLTSINLGPLTIQVWGTMVGLGFLVGYFYSLHRAKKVGFAKNHLQNLTLIILFLALLGSRLLHILLFPSAYISNPNMIWQVDQGGFVFVGGLLLALVGTIIYCRIKKVSFWKFADVIAPAVALGYGIGRIGCFLTDFHPGIATNLPWGFEYQGVVRHPTALYSSLAGFLIWLGLINYERRLLKCDFNRRTVEVTLQQQGKIALSFIALYTLYRFGVDFLRAWDLDFERRFFGLTLTQYSLPFITLCLFLAREKNRAKNFKKLHRFSRESK